MYQFAWNYPDADEDCAEVKQLCRDGWPAYLRDSPSLQSCFEKRAHLTLHKGLLIYDDRIVIPKTMRLETLNKIHQGHLGITTCHARAREAVWWPGILLSIEEMIKTVLLVPRSDQLQQNHSLYPRIHHDHGKE